MKVCDKCGYKHKPGPCSYDIYQQLDRDEGPPAAKVMLAFVSPILIFIGVLLISIYVFSGLVENRTLRTLIAFFIAFGLSVAFVQLIRKFTRKPLEQ